MSAEAAVERRRVRIFTNGNPAHTDIRDVATGERVVNVVRMVLDLAVNGPRGLRWPQPEEGRSAHLVFRDGSEEDVVVYPADPSEVATYFLKAQGPIECAAP